MYKNIFYGVAFLLLPLAVQAQHIPDLNFAQAIADNCPTCIDGNNDLTIDAQSVAVLYIDGYGITDLMGIGGFSSLDTLFCRYNSFMNLPTLPSSLKYLDCSGNNDLTITPTFPSSLEVLVCTSNSQWMNLPSLPSLPSGLKELYCYNNQWTSLPALPSSLQILNCSSTDLTSLPALPSSLTYLDCSYSNLTSLPTLSTSSLEEFYCQSNQLTSLPALPNGLTKLYCFNNQLTSLPALPSSLQILNCYYNNLISLPAIPSNLKELYCYFNDLTSLPALSTSSLEILNCKQNSLASLPALPSSLQQLDCNNNQLMSLPALPSSLTTLNCGSNYLANLPALSSSLTNLICYTNFLTSLPALPSGLTQLDCHINQLTNLPALPSSLTTLNCGTNYLANLPALPSSLTHLTCNNNPSLSCLPFLPTSLSSFSTSNTGITCLPNRPPNFASNPLPDCGAASACFAYPRITGRVYIDYNSNNSFDTGIDAAGPQQLLAGSPSYNALSDASGNYVLGVPENTNTTVTCSGLTYNPAYFTQNPASYSISTGAATGQTYANNDFRLVPTGTFYDLSVDVTSGIFRPGFQTTLTLTYRNVGTHTLASGTLQATIDGDLTILSTSVVPSAQAGNTLDFSFSNLAPFQPASITVNVLVPASVALGTAIGNTFAGTIANDADMLNNTDSDNQLVVGSYDPNDKNGDIESMTPAELAAGKEIEYTIRFQNTGTFPATFVTVEDTIDSSIDLRYFQTIATSHPLTSVSISNDLTDPNAPVFVRWNFNNINLADATSNEPESHGYIKFKVRPQQSLVAGDYVPNSAAIFFDYNTPVITNEDSVHICEDSYASINVSACDSLVLNGQTYTTSGTYTQTLTNAAGCDSVLTINVTINNSSSNSISASACDNYTHNGQTYTASGTYTQTLTNAAGCDSVLTINLSINNSSSNSISASACDSYTHNGQTYTTSGTYTQTLTNAAGCDSVLTINVSIEEIDTTLSLNGFSLSSNESGASYQWLDCSDNFNPIIGATAQDFTPTVTGDFAVDISKNNCTRRSECRNVVISAAVPVASTNDVFSLYPNPTTGDCTLLLQTANSGNYTVNIYDALGRNVWSQQFAAQAGEQRLPLSLEHQGLYVVELRGTDNDNHWTGKVVVVK